MEQNCNYLPLLANARRWVLVEWQVITHKQLQGNLKSICWMNSDLES